MRAIGHPERAGFTRPILLNALPTAEPQRLAVELVQKGVDEGRFADPGLTRHEDDLALATECLL
jgi:hypothetical protein